MKTAMPFSCQVHNGGRQFKRAIHKPRCFPALALCLALLRASAQTNDARGPIPVSANSPDGWSIGVCFDKPLSEASATNVANYSLSEPGYAIASAILRPDLQSVTLRLDSQYNVPFRQPQLRTIHIVGLDGLSTAWTNYVYTLSRFTATDVGTLGSDPKEAGNFFTCLQSKFEIVSTGSGWEATNDGFYFVHQPFDPEWDFIYIWGVSSLEAANKDSSVGLMIREDLTPGSRFLSVSVTPTDKAARDGSGPGSALVKVLYRAEPEEVPIEVSGTRSIKGFGLTNLLWLDFSRWQSVNIGMGWEKRVTVGWINPVGRNYEVLAEVSFPVALTDAWRVGFAAASHNNDAGFSSRSVSSIQYSYYDPPPPTPGIIRAGSDVALSWTEFEGPSWQLVSNRELTSLTSWDRVTNAVARAPGPFYITNLVTVHTDGEGLFLRLRRLEAGERP